MLQRQFVLSICINLAGLLYVSANTEKFHDVRIQTLPAYMIASKANLLNSTCGKELQIFRDAVNQRILWSLKVLDSSGDYESGFLYGHIYWLGSHSQCLDTMNTIPLQVSQQKILSDRLYRDPRKEFPPFQISYFVAQFRHNSTLQYHINAFNEDVIMLGLCLPASCTTNDLSFILEEIFRDRVILINDLYSADFQLMQVKNLNDDNKSLPNGALGFMCVSLGLSFFLIAIGTIYDIFVYQKRIKKNETNKTVNGKENMSREIQTKANLSSHEESKIGKILICFSAYTNTKKIFSLELDAGTIPVIHGLKFFSNYWIISTHGLYYTMDFFDNKVWTWRYSESSVFTADLGLLSSDTFLLLSGCLVTYNYLRDKTNEKLIKSISFREKLIEFFKHIIKRLIRYFYAAVTIFSALLISSSIISGYIAYIYEYVLTLDEQERLVDVLYFPPWIRINSYFIGIIVGYTLTKLNNNLVLKKKIIIFCWCLAIASNGFVLFVLYKRYMSVLAISIYIAVQKILWGIGIAWVVIACSTKHGGIVDKLLSFKGWIPLSRLTYCTYLLNPVIIRVIRSSSEKSVHFNIASIFVMNIGITVLSFFCAYILSLMVEMPYILLTKIFIRSKVPKKEL